MARQNAYVPQSGELENCLVIVDVLPGRMVEIEGTQLKAKGARDVVSFDSLKPGCSWGWSSGDIGLNNEQVSRKLGKLKQMPIEGSISS
jgi:hypothetical protein